MKHTTNCKCGGQAERVAIQVGPAGTDRAIASWWCPKCGHRFITKESIYRLEEGK